MRATALLHQEGAIGLLAVCGLALGHERPLAALAPTIAFEGSLALGIAAGAAASLLLWLVRRAPAVRALEQFQRRLVHGWSVADGLSVALLSGLAEEALLRALLQPVVGLLPAALLFALLHLVPQRELWLWPVMALLLGVALGALYDVAGYPAAAAAHVVINGVALLRLRGAARG